MPCRKRFWGASVLGFAVLAATGCVNRPPMIKCDPCSYEVEQLSPRSSIDPIKLTVQVNDDDRIDCTEFGDSHRLRVEWTSKDAPTSSDLVQGDAEGEDTWVPVTKEFKVPETGEFNETGLPPSRKYVVNATVYDSKGLPCTPDHKKRASKCPAELIVTVKKDKQPPKVECKPKRVKVAEGKNVTLKASASDPNDDPLTYSWEVDESSVSGNTASLQFGTAGRSVGCHTATVTVKDSDNMTAKCTFCVAIDPSCTDKPKVTLSLDKSVVMRGQTVTATAKVTSRDPDCGPITYAWKVNGRSRSDSDRTYTVNTDGMGAGSHAVTFTASDRGGKGTATASFKVCTTTTIPCCLNNVAKAKLDEIALKMQQNPRLVATITGHTDSAGSEKGNVRVGAERANLAKEYLITQHRIAKSRIVTKSAGQSNPIADNKTREGRKENRRVEVVLCER